MAPAVLGSISEVWADPERLPITRFNSEVSPHRVFETRRFTLEEFKRIRSLVPGATINDAVLAVCGGALRRYLLAHDELPAPSLVAIAPLSIRNADSSAGAPAGMSLLRVPLGTEIEDPVRRLRTVRQHTARTEDIGQTFGAKELTDISSTRRRRRWRCRRACSRARALGQRAPLANCTITNVPGPAIPLYLNGARMTYFSAIMPISDGMGLVFSVTSYDGRIIISPTSCREQIPDPEYFALCIRESFQEYLELASAVGRAQAQGAGTQAGPPEGATEGGKKAKASGGQTRVPRLTAGAGGLSGSLFRRSGPSSTRSGRRSRPAVHPRGTAAIRPRAARGDRPRSTSRPH